MHRWRLERGFRVYEQVLRGTSGHDVAAAGARRGRVPCPSMSDERRTKDIYGRRATSSSRGRPTNGSSRCSTNPEPSRALTPRSSTLRQARSPRACFEFHRTWGRDPAGDHPARLRALLALLMRDLAAHGPEPAEPAGALDRERLVSHLDWRIARQLVDPGELQRSALHMARLGAWFGRAPRQRRSKHDASGCVMLLPSGSSGWHPVPRCDERGPTARHLG